MKLAEKERQGMEVDDVIPGTQPSSNETDGGFIMCEVEEQQAARVEVQGSKKKSDTGEIRRNARLRPRKGLFMKNSVRKKQMSLVSYRVR